MTMPQSLTGLPSARLRSRLAVAILCAVPPAYAQSVEWPSYGADSAETHYSRLDQITKANVRNLKPAWEWKTGETALPALQTTPGAFEVGP
jgi:glucose dehydrogenase